MKTISFFLILIMVISCSQKSKTNQITIRGKLLTNSAKNPISEIKFLLSNTDIAIKRDNYNAKVNKDSTFEITIPSEKNLFGGIVARNYYYNIYLSPGDNLYIEINKDSIEYKGKGAEKNNFLYSIMDIIFGYSKLYGEMKSLDSTLTAAKGLNSKIRTSLSEASKDYNLGNDFINFIRIYNENMYNGFLLSYYHIYKRRNKENLDSIYVPDEYKKLNTVKYFINDANLGENSYFWDLNSFIFYKIGDIREKYSIDYDSAAQIILFDSLTGKSKDYGIAFILDMKFSMNHFDTLLYNRFIKETKEPDALNFIQKSYDKYQAKQKLIGLPLNDEFNLTLLEDDKGNHLNFADMIKKYKGKVIFIDIWSLGCGPCRANMPKSKALKEKLKIYPIEFVYITEDGYSPDLWKNVYDISLTKDNHYRFIKGRNARLLKFLNINWVPNYMLIDKEGKLISFSAKQPSDPKLEQDLMKYIN